MRVSVRYSRHRTEEMKWAKRLKNSSAPAWDSCPFGRSINRSVCLSVCRMWHRGIPPADETKRNSLPNIPLTGLLRQHVILMLLLRQPTHTNNPKIQIHTHAEQFNKRYWCINGCLYLNWSNLGTHTRQNRGKQMSSQSRSRARGKVTAGKGAQMGQNAACTDQVEIPLLEGNYTEKSKIKREYFFNLSKISSIFWLKSCFIF